MTAALNWLAPSAPRIRSRIELRGLVQGVGFRPFVYREARARDLGGSVVNTPGGLRIEVEGAPEAIASLIERITREPPPSAWVSAIAREDIEPIGEFVFTIRDSALGGAIEATVPPDLAPCPQCLNDIFDPANRRYRYPFTNCTNCGPRYSILSDLPYDRARTSMRGFAMCEACEAEYSDPADRRFHAEPNACPMCGPRLAFWGGDGATLDQDDAALESAARALREGEIVAVKGVGGFHLMVDARNDDSVRRLRTRKRREEKPFAVMFPSLQSIEAACAVGAAEAALLTSPQRPIVLVRRRGDALAQAVAPGGNPCIGAMLPPSPLHALLLAELGFPVVATSGNRSDEPIVIDESEAPTRLGAIADCFLVHDRPILRPLDDSIARVVAGEPQILRRARGLAPLPVATGNREGVLALGGHLKTSLALSTPSGFVMSQHLGDLDTPEARAAYARALDDLTHLYRATPRVIARDAHPDYHSTAIAEALNLPTIAVQHHLAHVIGCMAEHDVAGPVLGVAFDGSGYGTDGTVWGGEFLIVDDGEWRRVASLRPFRLPGGETAIREPRRAALGLLFEVFGRDALAMNDCPPIASFSRSERDVLAAMIARGVNAPITTSAGRLFDAVAALSGLRQKANYEGQAAAELEWATDSETEPAASPTGRNAYPFTLRDPTSCDAPILVDWAPMLHALIADIRATAPLATIARRFHDGLAEAIVAVAVRAGIVKVALTGGCFQNAYLTEKTIEELRAAGCKPYWHQRTPPGDGGLSLGQAVWAARVIAGQGAP